MEKVLILSHTQGYSDFKIGSHHYANGLSKIGYDVFYSGIPRTIFHKLLRRKNSSPYKLNERVSNTQLSAIFPLTVPMGFFTSVVNPFMFSLFEVNRKVKGMSYQAVICDSPFFYPLLKNFRFENLYYRPTDNYVAMVGEKAFAYEKKMCDESKMIICTSQAVSDNIIRSYGVCRSRVKIITNGYDSEHFFKINDRDENRKNAIYIGALDYRFDFDALMVLAEGNKDIIFDIYGPIERKYKAEILKFRDIGNVIFHGKIDYSVTNELMNKYKVGLLLLKKTNSNFGRSPMKLWEYLASGLNVIYANVDNVELNEKLFKYDGHADMISKFKRANEVTSKIKKDILENNSWRGKVIELNNLIF
ncbi:TPA: glycosyltransferase [Serratia marcescens]